MLIAVVMFIACVSGVMAGGPPDKEKTALETATRWIALVDSEKYAESWAQASEFFKTSIEQEKWERIVWEARRPLVTLRERKMIGSSYETSLAGAPEGEYAVIQFRSLYFRRLAIETVTVSREKDGAWRVCGCNIH